MTETHTHSKETVSRVQGEVSKPNVEDFVRNKVIVEIVLGGEVEFLFLIGV